MNQADDKRDDDEAWLEALAGRQTPVPDGRVALEVTSLRRALQVRKSRLEAQVPKSDQALCERILEEIEATEHAKALNGTRVAADVGVASAGSSERSVTDGRFYRVPVHGADGDDEHLYRQSDHPVYRARRNPWIWGFATMTLAAVIAIPIWLGSDGGDDELVLRSGPDVTAQIVADPDSRAKELSDLLQAVGVKPRIERKKDGAVVILIESTPEALDILASQRLMPQPKDGKIVILLEKQNSKKP
jgi:hypothetical protein